MGFTGFILKDLAAITGPFGYTLKGIHKELSKSSQPTHFIRKARIRQGQRDLAGASPEERQKLAESVSHGWSIVQQVWAVMEEKRTHGLRGRISAMRERKTWRANGAFENVEMAEKALAARNRGEGLEGVFKEQKEELEKARRPRNPAIEHVPHVKGRKFPEVYRSRTEAEKRKETKETNSNRDTNVNGRRKDQNHVTTKGLAERT